MQENGTLDQEDSIWVPWATIVVEMKKIKTQLGAKDSPADSLNAKLYELESKLPQEV